MGIYNNNQQRLPKKLQDGLCPFCNGNMNETDTIERRENDSFDFTCKSCNPEIIISLSGGLVSNLDALIKDNERRLDWIRQSIKNSTGKVFSIVEGDFR